MDISPCPVADCQWSDWSEWSGCTADCDGGQQTRYRHIATTPGKGGRPCPALNTEEVNMCNLHKCANQLCVDGAWADWEAWQPCSSSCKGGVTWRARAVAREANFCGKPAIGPMRTYGTCNDDVPCTADVDCEFGDWQSFGACSGSCGGVMMRSRVITKHGRANGKFCTGSLQESAPCNPAVGEQSPAECVGPPAVDCVLEDWTMWSACSQSCDGGSQTRTRGIQQQPSNFGKPCEDALDEVQPCSLAPCSGACSPQDCKWSEWGGWSACDKCGGQMRRFRHVISEAQCGGRTCDAWPAEETTNCTRKCHEPVYCVWSGWEAWSACSATCGSAEKTRHRRLTLTTAPKGIAHSPDVYMKVLENDFDNLQLHTRALQTRRLQDLVLSFSFGGITLVVGMAIFRLVSGVIRRSRGDETSIYSEAPTH